MKKIAIIGTVGIGKSTVIEYLKDFLSNLEMKVHFYKEEEKYIYLSKYYDDMNKYSLLLQFDFLMSRLRMVNNPELSGVDIIIYDRSYVDDYIYATLAKERGEMTSKEFEMYKYCYNKFSSITREDNNEVDILFVLRESEPGLANYRRGQRNRFQGREVDKDHFKQIDEFYNSNLIEIHSKKLVKKIIPIINSNSKETARIIKGIICEENND